MIKQSIKTTALLFVCFFVINFSTYAVKPVPPASDQAIELNEKNIINEIEKGKGKKLSLFEKLITKSLIKRARKKNKAKNNKLKNGAEGEVKKGMAIASLVLGIVPFLAFIPVVAVLAVPAAILAIVFGVIAKRKARENPEEYGGKGLAVAGMILGIVFLALVLLVLLILLAFLAA